MDTQLIIVIAFLSLIGIAALGAITFFIIGVLQQKRYDNQAMPSLGIEKEETVIDDNHLLYEDEYISESVFTVTDNSDDSQVGDIETDRLLKDVQAASINISKDKKTINPFNRKK